MELQLPQSSDVFEEVAGWLGSALALFFFISPAILMYKLYKRSIDVGKIPCLLLLMSAMNCLLWFVYGVRNGLFQVWLCNGIGGMITIVWIIFFLFYYVNFNLIKFFICVFFTLHVFFLIIYIFMWIIPDEHKNVSGNVAMAFNIVMYAAPGQNIYYVFKTGNYDLIPIVSSIIGFFCSLCWGIFGVYKRDINIIIPNGLGILFSIIQIAIWYVFYMKKKVSHSEKDYHEVEENRPLSRPQNCQPTVHTADQKKIENLKKSN